MHVPPWSIDSLAELVKPQYDKGNALSDAPSTKLLSYLLYPSKLVLELIESCLLLASWRATSTRSTPGTSF